MSPLLRKVLVKLANARIQERYIAPGQHDKAVYGQIEGGIITINPVPAIVETLLHEGVHAVNWDYSETTVERLTTRLFYELTEDEMKLVYDIYRGKLR
jgi:hypothetical protein